MADELTLLTQMTIPMGMTVADGAGIEKGTVLQLTDPNTASASAGAGEMVAGVLAYEKIASNGQTKASVITGPGDVFKATASGAIVVGQAVTMDGGAGTPNRLRALQGSDASGSRVFGFARETAADGETFRVVLNIQHNGPEVTT